jgi:hypothetical protein
MTFGPADSLAALKSQNECKVHVDFIRSGNSNSSNNSICESTGFFQRMSR